jgi:hypothetical protein
MIIITHPWEKVKKYKIFFSEVAIDAKFAEQPPNSDLPSMSEYQNELGEFPSDPSENNDFLSSSLFNPSVWLDNNRPNLFPPANQQVSQDVGLISL